LDKLGEKMHEEIEEIDYYYNFGLVIKRCTLKTFKEIEKYIKEKGVKVVYVKKSPGSLWIIDREPSQEEERF
jgi:hypothetical protein